jgi:hypothetical protein
MLQDQASDISDLSKALATAQVHTDQVAAELNTTIVKLRQQLAMVATTAPARQPSRLGRSNSWAVEPGQGAKGAGAEAKLGADMQGLLAEGQEQQQQLIGAHWAAAEQQEAAASLPHSKPGLPAMQVSLKRVPASARGTPAPAACGRPATRPAMPAPATAQPPPLPPAAPCRSTWRRGRRRTPPPAARAARRLAAQR